MEKEIYKEKKTKKNSRFREMILVKKKIKNFVLCMRLQEMRRVIGNFISLLKDSEIVFATTFKNLK
jgi:hypothetical protein